MAKTDTSPLVFNDTVIRDRDTLLCLTDMWRAAGEDNAQRPANWARKEGADFIAKIRENVPEGHILESRPGRGGGTWAHWQIGMAYAQYLSPEFHAWCNDVVRSYMEGTPPPQPKDERWLKIRTEGKAIRKDYTSTLVDHGVSAPKDFARCTDAVYVGLLGKPARRLKEDRGLPARAVARDSLTRLELASVTLSEELAIEGMEDERSWGVRECADVSARAARSVHRAVEDHRNTRALSSA